MKTSRELFDTQDQTPIPVNGKFKFYDRFGTISAERVTENTLPASEFRDLAVQARRRAVELMDVAEEMDAWLLKHTQ